MKNWLGCFLFSCLARRAAGFPALLLAFALSFSSAAFADWVSGFAGRVNARASAGATAIDAANNVYVAGTFAGTLLPLGNTRLTRLGTVDIFVAKYDAAGTLLWAKNFGGNGATLALPSLAVDGGGNVYLGGTLPASIATPALTALGTSDAYAIKLDSAGNLAWAKRFGDSGVTLQARGIAVDGAGNVYLGGVFNASLASLGLNLIGNQDGFALKLDAAGTTVWAKGFGGATAQLDVNAIAVDGPGNVYLGGAYNQPLSVPALTRLGVKDGFAVKLDSAGNTLWAKNFGGAGASAQVLAVAADAGNVYLGGSFSQAALSVPAVALSGTSQAFAFKLDAAAGNTAWAKAFGGGAAVMQASGIAVDGGGNVYLGGSFNAAGATTPTFAKISVTASSNDAFVLKLDAAGNPIWANNYGGPDVDAQPGNLAVSSGGNAVLAGNAEGPGSIRFTTPTLSLIGGQNAFVFMLDGSGNAAWAKGLTALGNGGNVQIRTAVGDGAGNLYVAGTFASLELNLGNVTLTRHDPGTNIFIAKLDANGTVVWAKNYNSIGNTYVIAPVGADGLAVDAVGNVYLAGVINNFTMSALSRIGVIDAVLYKFDGAGNLLWVKNYGGASASVYVNSVKVDRVGNVFLGGSFCGGRLTTPLLDKIGICDGFLFKLDGSGNVAWAKSFAGGQVNVARIAFDEQGNIFATGTFSGTGMTLPPLARVTSTYFLSSDVFVIKLDAAGSLLWAQRFGGAATVSTSVTLLLADGAGNVYLGGVSTWGSMTVPPVAGPGGYLIKLDGGSGSVSWSKGYPDADLTAGAWDGSGNLYLVGALSGESLADPALTRIGTVDAFAFKVDAAGTTRWAENYGGSGAVARSAGLALDSAGNLILAGTMSGASLTTPALAKLGSGDSFVLKRVLAAPPGAATPAPSEVVVGAGGTATLGSLPVVSLGGGSVVILPDATSGRVMLQATASTVQATSLALGGRKLDARPLGGQASFSVQAATYQGKNVPVMQLAGGTASLSAPANLPFLTLDGSLVSAGDQGAQVTASGAKLAVVSGSVVLTTPGNVVASDKTLVAYAGEVVENDGTGKLVLRVGSLSGSDGATGDPLPAGEGMPAAVKLTGKLGRLGDQSPLDALAGALGQATCSQNADGSLGPTLRAVPVAIRIDSGRADGVQGSEVAKNGLIVKLLPLLPDVAAFTRQVDVVGASSGSSLSMDSAGVLNVTSAGKQYVGRAALTAKPSSAADGFSADAQGNLVWVSNGLAQIVYPAFRYADKLVATLLAIDPKATLTDNGDGSYALTLAGQAFRLRPSYQILNLFDFPAAHRHDAWWQEGGTVFINYGNVTAQGVAVQ